MSYYQELRSLADYLSKKQETILREWEQGMKQEDKQPTELDMLSREGFRDNIPKFLELLFKALRDENGSTKTIAKEHGEHRWEYGLSLEQTINEWSLLQNILMKKVNRYQESASLGVSSLKEAYNILTEHIHQGIVFSIKKFNKLQQSEAEAQFEDLKNALKEPDQISYTEDLRQTSHDIKGMVHILRTGFYLLNDKEFDEKTRQTLEQMSTAADDLNRLLNDLLDLFRIESGKEKLNIQSFDVADVLQSLCESYRPVAETEQLDLHCKGQDGLTVQSDPEKVKRIIQNLVLNSLKYTQSGFVEVEWKQKENNFWTVQVRDTGPGLDTTSASSLTTKADSSASDQSQAENINSDVQGHGEGIGLLIVRRLCNLLNAVIKVETEKGEGTVYRITFPLETQKPKNR